MKSVFSQLITGLFCILASTAQAYEGRIDKVMPRAHEAIRDNDLKEFGQLFGRAALCHWGTVPGLAALKEGLPNSSRKMINEITLDKQGHLPVARFVGFWAYYEQTYALKVMDKSRALLAEGKIECHYGLQTTKRESDLNRSLDYYTIKNCRVVVFEARTFPNPPAKPECAVFRQRL